MDRPNFPPLSDAERDVVGTPDDYDWEHPIKASPARQARGHFSMRVDPELHRALIELAAQRGVRFSELVREALESALGRSTGTTATAFVGVTTITVTREAGTVVLMDMDTPMELGFPTKGPFLRLVDEHMVDERVAAS